MKGPWLKKGREFKRKKKYFPSYLLVRMEMNKELYHMIKNIQKVTGFLGTTGNPVPVSDIEIGKILGNIKEGSLSPEPSLSFEVGEQVKVCEGPFASFSGLVEDVDEDKLKLKVSVSIFGRPTPIELEYNQVEKS
jgi:transcriptional antiterminator NusG